MLKEKIIIGSDHAGFLLKEKIKSFLLRKGFQVNDVGAFSEERCDYPVFALAVAKAVSCGKYKRGILICKSGIGNSIVANRLRGVRAALCHNTLAAKLSRRHNDSNILVMGSAFVKPELAKRMVGAWLKTEFMKGRHLKRLKLINNIGKECLC
ncbi:MAG: ribose 5-phosphate isomerase B [Candidatus Omnitrophota bacterium]|jgi:ribose 5-phosphate isomerase B|nr:MAG: ribose 5-phosphate isomerase B [Candidatus Omnitrophota bacterium]